MTDFDLNAIESKIDGALSVELLSDDDRVEVGRIKFLFPLVAKLIAEMKTANALLEDMTRQRDAFSKGKKAVMVSRMDDKRALEFADLLSNAVSAFLRGPESAALITKATIGPLEKAMMDYVRART